MFSDVFRSVWVSFDVLWVGVDFFGRVWVGVEFFRLVWVGVDFLGGCV